ncbi:zf-HC2 domain-containing protein [Mariprofundus aestuarium]|nr:zf-HC2 domain-containing protein [Mariprofundus aestuarium]
MRATRLASDSIDRKLTLWERLRFHLHLAMCRNCRNCEHTLRLIRRTTELMRETQYGNIKLTDLQRERLHAAINGNNQN